MSIINIRVDERLIHGQVANMWTQVLNISRIMVIDNTIANSDIDKLTLKMAVPAGVRLSVLPADTAVKNILAGKYDSQRVFILVKNIATLIELKQQQLPMPEVNIANLTQLHDAIPITKSVSISKQDVAQLLLLEKSGTLFVSQRIPNEDKLNLSAIINNLT